MPQVYGLLGLSNVMPGAMFGPLVPTIGNPNLELGQQFFVTSTTPPTEYTWNGQTWTAPNATQLTVTTDSGVATVSANNLNLLGAGGISSSATGSTITLTGTEVDLSSPPPIGDVAPNTGAFTEFTATAPADDIDITAQVGDLNLVSTAETVQITGGTRVNINSAGILSIEATTELQIEAPDNIIIEDGSIVFDDDGTQGISYQYSSQTDVAASPIVINSRQGLATFTSVSIAAAADLTLTITNAQQVGTQPPIISWSGVTTGAAVSLKSVTASTGSIVLVMTNGTGATTSTADIVVNFICTCEPA